MTQTQLTTGDINSWKANNKKSIVNLSNGKAIFLVRKSTTQFALYDTTDRITYTLRGTYTCTAQLSLSSVAIEVSGDETFLIVAVQSATRGIYTRRIVIATWVADAEQVAYPPTANVAPQQFDLSISATGATVLGFLYAGAAGDKIGYIIRFRTAAGVWSNLEKFTTHATATFISGVAEFSIQWYDSVVANVRRFGVFPSYGVGPANDIGVQHFHCSVNESTGASFSKKVIGVIPETVMAKPRTSYTPTPRKTWIWSRIGINEIVFGAIVESYTLWPTPTYYPKAAVGFIKITTLGANAAADTVLVSINGVNGRVKPAATYAFALTLMNHVTEGLVFNFLAGEPPRAGATPLGSLYSYAIKLSGDATNIQTTRLLAGDVDGDIVVGANFGSTSAKLFATSNPRHDFMVWRNVNIVYAGSMSAPTPNALSPASGQTVATSKPPVAIKVPNRPWRVDPPMLTPTWEVATDVGFTTSLKSYTGPAKGTGTFSPGVSETWLTANWGGLAIPSAVLYMRGKVRDYFGNESSWIALASPFTITHPASTVNVSPVYGDPLEDNVTPIPYLDPNAIGYTQVAISWATADAWAEDLQSAYRIIATNMTTMAVVYDSGKILSAAKNAFANIPFASKNQFIVYSVQTWDAYDQSAGATGIGSFVTYSPPTVNTIGLVTQSGGLVNSNAPTFSYALTASLYDITRLNVMVSQGSTILYTDGIDNPGLAGNFAVPNPILENTQNYTVQMWAIDSYGLAGTKTLAFTTAWTPPAAPPNVTVDTVPYNTENQGYVRVAWDDVSQDADLIKWRIYRKIDLLDLAGGVVEEGPLEFLGEDVDAGGDYLYNDYYAPSGSRVGYVVRQVVNRFGSILESTNTTPIYVYPQSDGYWLIDPTPEDITAAAFKLHIVTADSYKREYEEEMLHIIGRGRHVERGDYLGITGGLSCQIRDTSATTARQKKIRLEAIKAEVRNLYLRTPFGDSIFVNVGDMDVSRIAGVGTSEFCDITVPYQEVYNG